MYILFKYGKNRPIKWIYTILILINTLIPLAGNTYYTLKNSFEIHKDLNNLSAKEIIVNVKGMNGIIYNLKDYHIKYQLDSTLTGKELYYHYLEYQEK